MSRPARVADGRFTLVEAPVLTPSFARDVVAGLRASPKRLSCVYFYDEEGSLLFEAICDLPEYYLTRAETAILVEQAQAIAALFPAGTSLVELGSGSARKTRLLVDAFLRRHGRLRYVPIDISRTMLEASSLSLLADFPALAVTAIAAEYQAGLRLLAERHAPSDEEPRLILWLGSNIGNFDRTEAAAFLGRLRSAMGGRDRLLVGIDLRKDRHVLEAAYDDARGVTARFNLNLLTRINRELQADFDVARFRHLARYDEDQGRIDMYLVSDGAQRVRLGDPPIEIHFTDGEWLHTESSYKYSEAEIRELSRAAGLRLEHRWLDPEGRFALCLLGR